MAQPEMHGIVLAGHKKQKNEELYKERDSKNRKRRKC